MSEYLDKMVKLLNQKELSNAEGVELCRAVSLSCNTYCRGKMFDAFQLVSKEGKKRLELIACFIGLSFARERTARGKHTRDERKRASEDFACLHEREFFSYLREAGMISLDSVGSSYTGYVAFTPGELKEYRDSWLAGFMSEWRDEHSTLKQVFFGQIARFLCGCGVLKCEAPCFPFI